MKLNIKTKDVEIEYEDNCQWITSDARDNIKDIVTTVLSGRAMLVAQSTNPIMRETDRRGAH